MRAPLRVGALLGALGLVAGGSALLGGSVGTVHEQSPGHGDSGSHASAEEEPAHGESHDSPRQAARTVAGLAVAEDGYRLDLIQAPQVAGERGTLRFRILGPDGAPERDFDPEQGGIPLHLIVVRRDLTGFQHLHPRMSADGTWQVALSLPEGGSYRAFADFTLDATPRTLGVDLAAGGELRPRALPAPSTSARAGEHTVRAEPRALRAGEPADLVFQVEGSDGEPAVLQPYLGADGHLVALREGDLAYLHVHPDESDGRPGRIAFGASFPSAGRYRLFLQFKREGRVELAPFTVEVVR